MVLCRNNISKLIKYKDADLSCGSFTFAEYSSINNEGVNGISSSDKQDATNRGPTSFQLADRSNNLVDPKVEGNR